MRVLHRLPGIHEGDLVEAVHEITISQKSNLSTLF